MLYILRTNFYRSKGKFTNPIDEYEEFRDDNIINARERCFEKYQSYIDILLESNKKKYLNYENAKQELKDFIYSGKTETKFGFPFYDDCGINISFVFDESIEYEKEVTINNKKRKMTIYKQEICIHGLENLNNHSDNDLKKIYLKNLKKEKDIYDENDFEIRNLNNEFKILKTPIEF